MCIITNALTSKGGGGLVNIIGPGWYGNNFKNVFLKLIL